MKTKTFWLFCIVLLSNLLLAQSPQPSAGTSKRWVLPRDISVSKAQRLHPRTSATTVPSTCNNNGLCELQLGESCTVLAQREMEK
jgi:hypothetical protein